MKPIVYYLDPGAPEPIRSALLEGARWWNQAFEAAGYRNAFRVELLPEGVSPLDIRYNVINWVHRSTRGWSTGGSVIDPRTGEIIKGVVTLGSLRDPAGLHAGRRPAVALQDRHRDAAGAQGVGARAHPAALRARGRPHDRPRPQLLRQHRRPHLGDGLPAPAGHAQGRRHARLLEGLRRRHRRVGQGVHHLRLPGLPCRHRRGEGARGRSSTTRGRRTCSTSRTRTSRRTRASISGRTAPTPPPNSGA